MTTKVGSSVLGASLTLVSPVLGTPASGNFSTGTFTWPTFNQSTLGNAGTNPNTGEQVDEKSCAIAWMPMLMIENSMQQRSTSAAVESFRNEMVQNSEINQQILLAASNKTNERLISNIWYIINTLKRIH